MSLGEKGMVKLTGNSILEKARSFAKLLAETRELQRFYYAQEMLRQDREASALLRNAMAKQREIQAMRVKGGVFSADRSAEIQRIQRELEDNAVISDWARARSEAVDLIQATNQVISNIAGVDLSQSAPRSGSCR